MSAPEESLRSRVRVLVGCLAVFVLAVLAGVGGPPSGFKPQVPPLIAFLGRNILEIYAAGALVAAVSIVAGLASGRAGRIAATAAYAFTTLGNIVSWAIASEKEGQLGLAVFFAVVSVPFLLLMWWPERAAGEDDTGADVGSAAQHRAEPGDHRMA